MTNITLNNLDTFAKDFLESLSSKGDTATVVALQGNLGAGKTTFTKAFAKALGIEEIVTSPTFVIEKIYKVQPRETSEVEPRRFRRLIHIDAYRLESSNELLALGFEEKLADPGNLILLEWPEKVPEALPHDMITILFEVVDENTRSIEVRDGQKTD